MSAGSSAGYVPVDGTPETDFEYAQRFVDLATAIDGCARSDDVAVLLSTCRNHWMTTNAVFLDLKRALGAGDYPDSISTALYEIGRGRAEATIENLDKAAEYLAYARGKLRAWGDRTELYEQLSESVERLGGISSARVKSLLQEQRETAPAPEAVEHIKYLVLSDREEPSCMESLRRLTTVADALEAIHVVAKEVALMQASEQGSLFNQEVGEDEPPKRLTELLAAELSAWELEEGGGTTIRFGDDSSLEADLSLLDPEAWRALVGHLCAVCRKRLVGAQELLVDFRANSARPPMPEPYIVDLTPKHYAGTAKTYEVEVTRVPGGVTPNHAKVALLKWGIPGDAFNLTEMCRFERPGHVGAAGDVIRAAVAGAAENDAAFLIMPEVCVPEEMVDTLGRQAEEFGVGIIAGREHWAQHDGRTVNEALIHVPRLANPIRQRKQEPSAAEHREERFAADRVLRVIGGTALGRMLVVVCSDYLEHDVVTRAWLDQHIDTLVVCARNPNPAVFERLAMADAIREYCNVIVVNSFPGDDAGAPPSGAGTVVAVPRRDEPLLELDEQPLEVEWAQTPKPSLAIAELDMKAVFSRSLNRSDRGYLRPSRFAAR